jgi:hypothetical protein
MRHLALVALLLAGGAVAGCGGDGGGGNGRLYGPWRDFDAPDISNVAALWAFAPTDVWAGGRVMLHFDGTAFAPVATPALGVFVDLWGVAPNDLYAVTEFELLHWDGAAWTLIDFAGAIDPGGLTSVWASSGYDVWLGDSLNGQVFHWDGTAWSMGTTQTVDVADLWGVPGGPVFAGGGFGLSQWTGSEWVDIHDPTAATEAATLWGFGAGDVWAASDFGTLAHWDGATWTNQVPAGTADFTASHNAIWGAAPDDVWAVGDLGVVSRWNGGSWTQATYGPFPYLPFLSEVHGSSAGDVWAAGRNGNKGAILHYEP